MDCVLSVVSHCVMICHLKGHIFFSFIIKSHAPRYSILAHREPYKKKACVILCRTFSPGLSKVAGCRQKSPLTLFVSAGYSLLGISLRIAFFK